MSKTNVTTPFGGAEVGALQRLTRQLEDEQREARARDRAFLQCVVHLAWLWKNCELPEVVRELTRERLENANRFTAANLLEEDQ